MDRILYDKVDYIARAMRRDIIEMAYNCGGNAHLGGGLSIVEILAVLYGAVMRYDPKSPEWPGRDRFVLSKGHGVLGLYAALCEAGYFEKELLSTFEQNDSMLSGHPIRNLPLGIESSNGSLGQGLAFCIGMAIHAKLKGEKHRIFTLMGDGECNEGSVWEAVMFAPQKKLDNLTAIIDVNGLQLDGFCEDILKLTPFEDKFAAFGWRVITADGHSIEELYGALSAAPETGKPTAIIANTVKGKGFSFMENVPEWHHNRVTEKLYKQALEELGVKRDG